MKDIITDLRRERDELLSRPYVKRHTKYDTAALLDSHLIKLITGPRRAGKSTQALQMLRGRNFAYLNFDSQPLLDRWEPGLVMRTLDEVYPGYDFLLLDEVQNLPSWDMWVSGLYRLGKNMVITGSNAKLLSGEMATVLTGRYLQVEMLPFNFAEYTEWHKANTDTQALAADYLRLGGYPETLAARQMTRSYLEALFDATVLKDIVKRHNVRKTTDINSLATYLVSNFCNPFSVRQLATDLNLASLTTTQKYLDYLHEPYLFYYLSRYDNKLKAMRKAPRKAYVVDNGFVAAKAFAVSDNLGRLLENQVFTELLRRGYNTDHTLFYYRSRNDKEVDFVLRKGVGVECLVQACYDLTNEKTLKREVSSLVECAGELHCNNLKIITWNDERTIERDGYTIRVVPVTKF